ncbi:transporter, major facilitator family domain containing protein, putative, partial [Eimeria necatrix]
RGPPRSRGRAPRGAGEESGWGRMSQLLLRSRGLLLPSVEHPAAAQATPFRLNRYLLLGVYMLYTLLTSCVYFGWGPLSSMLYKAGVSLWLCSTEEQSEAQLSEQPVCRAQDTSVQNLFTICYASHFIVSAAAGLLVDTAGPKVTALLGQTLNICGWVFLGASNASFRAVVPAFVLIGAGSDLCFIPVLCIANLFPGSVGFALTALGVASSLSFAVPLVLRAVQTAGVSFRWVCWGYAVLGPCFCFIIVSLFVPLGGFIQVDMFVLVRSPPRRPNLPAASPPEGPRRRSCSPEAEARAVALASPAPTSSSSSSSGRSSRSSRGSSSSRSRSLSFVSPIPDVDELSSVTDDSFFKPFHREALTFLYVGVCLYFGVCSIAINYYQQAANQFLLEDAREALNIAIPLSTLPTLFLGRLADFVPIVYIMLVVNTAGALSYGLAISRGLVGDMVSVCCFSVYISMFSSQVYIYIKDMFTSVNYGRLVGVASMVGGCLSLLSNELYKHYTDVPDTAAAEAVMWGVFGTVCGAYLLLLPMLLLSKKRYPYRHGGDFVELVAVAQARTRPRSRSNSNAAPAHKPRNASSSNSSSNNSNSRGATTRKPT